MDLNVYYIPSARHKTCEMNIFLQCNWVCPHLIGQIWSIVIAVFSERTQEIQGQVEELMVTLKSAV